MGDDSENLVEVVQRDHREVEQLLNAVAAASGQARRRAFEELVAKLKAHEAAEQKVVHPLVAKEGDPAEAKALQAEESAASSALKHLQGVDVDSPEFEAGFAQLKADVLAHAHEEEHEEHPRLTRETSNEELERRGQEFEQAEREAAGS